MEGFTRTYYSSTPGCLFYQRCVVDIPGVFPHPFSLLLEKNNKVDHCVENDVLQVTLKPREKMDRAVSSFSEAFARIGIGLSSFNGWLPQSVTRFTLVTVLKSSPPELRIDADPSSIQYQPSSFFLSGPGIDQFLPPQTVQFDDINVLKSLTTRRTIKLVQHNNTHYVLKTIERYDELSEWEHELKALLVLRDSPNIIDIAAFVDIANPYCPNKPRVVSGFLIEYASSGSLFDILEGNGRNEIELRVRIKWALDVALGLHNMHTKGLVHGDIKPRNVVITSLNVAKLIDFAGKGYTRGYHAPEMLSIIDNDTPWPPTLDIYSLGILVNEIFHGESLLTCLISACLSQDPKSRPKLSQVISSMEELLSQYAASPDEVVLK
jgi:Protein kinase domain